MAESLAEPLAKGKAGWGEFFSAAGLIVLAAALAYLPYAARLGFYHDDWFTVASRVGGVYLTDMHAGDRPLMGWLYEAAARVLGERPLFWHLYAAAGRAAAALALWGVLKLFYGPARAQASRAPALTAGLLFALYPGFLQQPSANNYSNHILALGAGLFSLGLSLAALRFQQTPRAGRRRLLIGLMVGVSAVLSRLYPAVYETFIGLEAARVLLLLCAAHPLSGRWLENPGARIRRALLLALPNLAAAGWFVVWRLFVFESNRPATDTAVLAQSLAQGKIPLASFFSDFYNILIAAWYAPLLARLPASQPGALPLGMALCLILCVALWLGLHRQESLRAESAGEALTPDPAPLWVMLAWLAVSILPVLLAGRAARFDSYLDRYTLQSAPAAAALLAVGFGLLPRPGLRSAAAMTLAALALLTHTLNAANYAETWRLQRSLWWQLAWRAPQLKPDTVLIPLVPEGYNFVEDFEIWAPANRIYQPRPGEIYTSGAIVTGDMLDLMLAEGGIGRTWRLIRYEKRFDKALVLSIPSAQACLHVLDNTRPEPSASDSPTARRLAGISKPAERIRTGVTAAVPPADLFGPEPAHDWCYYYQSASLARQTGDWQTVRDLYHEAQQQNFAPGDAVEWLPFYQAFLSSGDAQTAAQIGERIRAAAPAWQAYCGASAGPAEQDPLSASLCRAE